MIIEATPWTAILPYKWYLLNQLTCHHYHKLLPILTNCSYLRTSYMTIATDFRPRTQHFLSWSSPNWNPLLTHGYIMLNRTDGHQWNYYPRNLFWVRSCGTAWKTTPSAASALLLTHLPSVRCQRLVRSIWHGRYHLDKSGKILQLRWLKAGE